MELKNKAKTFGDVADEYRYRIDNAHKNYAGVELVEEITKIRAEKLVPLEDVREWLQQKLTYPTNVKTISAYDAIKELLGELEEN